MSLFSSLLFQGSLLISSQAPVVFRALGPNVWISDPEIISVNVLGDKVHVLPKKNRGEVFVSGLVIAEKLESPQKLVVTAPENLAALRNCPQARVTLVPGGALQYNGAWADFKALQEKCHFKELTMGEDSEGRGSSEWVEREHKILESGAKILRSQWSQGRRLLILPRNSVAWVQKQLGYLAPFYELQEKDYAKPGQTLIFQLTLFEISRSKARSLGLTWPKEMRWTATGPHLDLLGSRPFELGADFGEALGIGRVLAQPMLRTLPGQVATFQSGGEFPIEMKTENEFSTLWKNYGLILEITPSKDILAGESEISVDFKVELSEPDFSVSHSQHPGLSKRALSSRFDLRVGEVTVLSSMLQSRLSSGRNGVAGLTDLPLIQALFSKKESLGNDSELWFGIQPTWEERAFPQNLQDYDHEIQKL